MSKEKSVTFHLETAAEEKSAEDITIESENIVKTIEEIVAKSASEITCSNVIVRREGTGISVMINCSIDGSMSLAKSHEISDRIEKRVMESFPEIIYVFVHIEPL